MVIYVKESQIYVDTRMHNTLSRDVGSAYAASIRQTRG